MPTDHQPLTVGDITAQLQGQFEGCFPARTVTEVVLRLSSNGAISLPTLAEMAKRELELLDAEGQS